MHESDEGASVELTREELIRHLEAATYKFAKTMPKTPHWYTLRKTWADEKLFEAAVMAARHYGARREWRGQWYVYFDAGEYEYWTGWEPANQCQWLRAYPNNP